MRQPSKPPHFYGMFKLVFRLFFYKAKPVIIPRTGKHTHSKLVYSRLKVNSGFNKHRFPVFRYCTIVNRFVKGVNIGDVIYGKASDSSAFLPRNILDCKVIIAFLRNFNLIYHLGLRIIKSAYSQGSRQERSVSVDFCAGCQRLFALLTLLKYSQFVFKRVIIVDCLRLRLVNRYPNKLKP